MSSKIAAAIFDTGRILPPAQLSVLDEIHKYRSWRNPLHAGDSLQGGYRPVAGVRSPYWEVTSKTASGWASAILRRT